jgi:amidohydrolase
MAGDMTGVYDLTGTHDLIGARSAAHLNTDWLDRWVAQNEPTLVATRRDLHAHPELGFDEVRTSEVIRNQLLALGLSPRPLPGSTGMVVDVGSGAPAVALRADIDALPLPDPKDVPYRSRNAGICHACGHDAHTAILLGVAGALAAAPELPGAVRLIFQPAEEQVPGGAPAVVAAGGLAGIEQIFALHCDPRLLTGQVGLRVGPITAACDRVEIRLSGPGGHTARPQLTVDLVYALGAVITQLPGLLSRRVDPRAGLSLVWGAVDAGRAPNAIPEHGILRGTVRMLDRAAWEGSEKLLRELLDSIVEPTGARAELGYHRSVPPVINDAAAVEVQRAAVTAALGPGGVAETEQSMGGEDFAWYLDHVPGALARLGVRDPASTGRMLDLHQGAFDIDERALAIGVRVMTHTALRSILAGGR